MSRTAVRPRPWRWRSSSALLAARGQTPASAIPSRGQSLFVAKGCVQCHAVRGAGGRIGPDLGRTAVKGSFFEIAAAMWNHSAAMDEKMREFRVARPSFEKEELADLLAFLYFLNYFDEPGDAAGRQGPLRAEALHPVPQPRARRRNSRAAVSTRSPAARRRCGSRRTSGTTDR